jgi:hypothetical protein
LIIFQIAIAALLLTLTKTKLTSMVLWIIIGVIVLLVIWIIGMYNGFVKARIKLIIAGVI